MPDLIKCWLLEPSFFRILVLNLGRFGPIPVRSGCFSPGSFQPCCWGELFDQLGMGCFGPMS